MLIVKFLFLVKIRNIYAQRLPLNSKRDLFSFVPLEMRVRLSHAVITFLVKDEINEHQCDLTVRRMKTTMLFAVSAITSLQLFPASFWGHSRVILDLGASLKMKSVKTGKRVLALLS